MKFLQIYVSSAYVSMIFFMSIIFGFTTDWHWHSFDPMLSLKLFFGMMLITIIIAIPSLFLEVLKDKSKSH